MRLLMLAGLLAVSGFSVLPAGADSDGTGKRSPSSYRPNIPTTSDRHAPIHVGRSPRVAGYTDRSLGWRADRIDLSGNPTRVVGRVIRDSNRFTGRKLQVSLQGQRWTINAPDHVFSVSEHGDPLSIHDLEEGDWVVAEGTQIGNTRLRALAIRKLGGDVNGYQRSSFFRPDFRQGYAMNITAGPDFRLQARESILGIRSEVAGERQETPSEKPNMGNPDSDAPK